MKSAKVKFSVRKTIPTTVSIDGRGYHTWRELAEAFELDIHDFSITEANR
ncbi:cytoplasmic protein [Klebsiella michiganensis]|uniref:Cytoplasmic protein n=1 Tax=Klebsiella michiganensis TaxID=1134687 RepID=A0A7H4MW10_9ENTR|nr:cytoplasmic protein [Klebsiella michiganensis]